MNDTDEIRFAQLMAVLGETFNRDVSSTLVEIYFRAFNAWDIDTFDRAVTKAILSCKFFPKPAELIELIEGSPADHTAQAEEAWRQLWKAINSAGTYRSLFCEDRILAESIRWIFGDWPAAGMLPRPESEDGPMYRVRQKEFVTAYTRLLSQRGAFEPYLMGRTEGDNDPKALAACGQGQLVTYLPRRGEPEAVELRALMPDHPLVALLDAQERRALLAREAQERKALLAGEDDDV